jgi:hypothetical protein
VSSHPSKTAKGGAAEVSNFGSGERRRMPGFAIAFLAGAFAFDVGIKAQACGGDDHVDGKYVPGILRDDVSDEEVDLVGGVDDFALAVNGVDGLNVVAAGADHLSAFELHAPEAGSGVEDEIVAFAVAPGTARCDSQADHIAALRMPK